AGDVGAADVHQVVIEIHARGTHGRLNVDRGDRAGVAEEHGFAVAVSACRAGPVGVGGVPIRAGRAGPGLELRADDEIDDAAGNVVQRVGRVSDVGVGEGDVVDVAADRAAVLDEGISPQRQTGDGEEGDRAAVGGQPAVVAHHQLIAEPR